MSPWLIVTTGWLTVTVTAGHALTASAARLLLPVAGTAIAAATVWPLAQWHHRHRKRAHPRPAPPSTS